MSPSTRLSMFERFYESFYQHPLLLWAVPVVFLFFLPQRSDFFALYLWTFTVLSITDALMTGPGAQWLGLSDTVAQNVAIFFVILGDARFFLVLEHFGGTRSTAPRPGTLRPTLTAIAWSFVVPVLQSVLIALFPEAFSQSRATFLAYEILFFVLAVVFKYLVIPRRQAQEPERTWLAQVCSFAMGYYALWASADIVILMGDRWVPGLSDWGFGLRVVPNVLYYGLFLPFVFWRAPLKWKGEAGKASPARLSETT